ncbi:double-strand break repair protein AddB [Tabrizicola sp. J26]|uniref:double-strand break repair protein AddB n=1 Tax=Alitabrizicola rongguiensis TaxID=2909234 RepID=UPI001F2290C3|nr:double-strand break repair protein AddB [Tabrizicola rongguiensis]MCF1708228.1 double-strand break repair protein AddB [Tabrizicola rongguiensis]
MFEAGSPRLFTLPPGADFAAALVAGLKERVAGDPPEAMASVELYVNSGRMLKAVRECFLASGAGYLPRLRLVTDPFLPPDEAMPAAIPPLRRRLELTQLIAGLLNAQPDLAPRAAIYDLADSLANLIDEMQGEGVPPEALSALDVSDHSAHWKRAQDFLSIVTPFFTGESPPDAEARRRMAVKALARRWQSSPPSHPVLIAGSTGSRGTTALLMQAVAALPQGAIILPGVDGDMPQSAWAELDDALTSEDHPQFRFRRLMELCGQSPADLRPWIPCSPPAPERNRLISLSLRPAPVTDRWLTEGQHLPDLVLAAQGMTLIEAPSPRAEALAIALVLREAAETDREVALVTADRLLARQVVAALDRWGITPDDSAGQPLGVSAPGRFLRHVAALFGEKLTVETLLVLLKHPITSSAEGRGPHLLFTRALELHLRRHGPLFPTVDALSAWAAGHKDPSAQVWAKWIGDAVCGLDLGRSRQLADHVARHRALAEALARGPWSEATGALWEREAGQAASAVIEDLAREAENGGAMTAAEYRDLFTSLTNQTEVRQSISVHPRIRIIGTREARECRADLVILGGLNDGVWPRLPSPDPWLNRQMRKAAGLLLPERQIGLSAHDYQQAVAAREVILTRALRDAEAETVPSRWINRLTNLMAGLPDRNGPDALTAMRDRGQRWLDLARVLERPDAPSPPAPRPAPRPPVALRPRKLPVTGISRLIRDPYAIYARYILRLYPLDPLRPAPDALARGSILHLILERFMREQVEETAEMARLRLLSIADDVLAKEAPWPAARALWRARLERVAPAFVARERAAEGTPLILEERGAIRLPDLDFTLTARPDRIDEQPDGLLHILDYKTGAPPTKKQQEKFDKQLLLEAAMAERGGFAALGPRQVARVTYVGLGAGAKIESTEIAADLLDRVWNELLALIRQYGRQDQGYASRRAMFGERQAGDYDHLARFGEWDMSDPPSAFTLTAESAE